MCVGLGHLSCCGKLIEHCKPAMMEKIKIIFKKVDDGVNKK